MHTADSSYRESLDGEVALEQARFLFRDSLFGLAASLALAVLLAIIFYPHIGVVPATAWFMALLAIVAVRMLVLRKARATELSAQNVAGIVWRVILLTFLTGFAWGALIVMAYPKVPGSLQFLFALIFVGMLAGAVAVYAGSFAAWLAFCAPIIVSGAYVLLTASDPESVRVLFFKAFFTIVVAVMAWRSERAHRASLRLGLENKGLVQRLTVARDNAENLYEENRVAYERLERADSILNDEADALRSLAEGRPLLEVLATLEEIVSRRLRGETFCNIIVFDDPGKRNEHVTPALATDYPIHDHIMREVGVLRIERNEVSADAADEHDLLLRITHYAGIVIERFQVLRLLERQARAINAAENAIFVLEPRRGSQRIVYANPAAGRLTGQAPEKLAEANLSSMLRLKDDKLAMALKADTIVERRLLLNGLRPDGTEFWAEATVASVSAGPEGANQMVMVINDITDRVTAEQSLHELSKHLLTVREDEMARIAREVHDEIGSLLTGLQMDLAWAKQRITERDPLLAEKCAAMMRLTDTTVDATRRIATGLRPSALDHLGVGAAIEEYAASFRDRTGLGCKVDVMLGSHEPNANQGIALFRIAQEGLTNVARHAHARHVQVQLSVQDHAYHLTITDDGVGMGSGTPKAALGLRGMRERVLALGGQFSVERGKGGGTVLDAWIPINQTENMQRAAQ